MSVPQPSKSLTGHCAGLNDNTLYVYDADNFQSLDIKENATWTEQKIGQSVASPACVTVAADGDEDGAALYVIGGDSGDGDYMGLQRYFFGNKTWETLAPPANVLQSRVNHSTSYLEDSQTILVYGGSTPQAPSLYSSQTFLISTTPGYNIQAFTSDAPPTNNAILIPWNSSHAALIGGESTSTSVWLFGPESGWQQLPTNLSEPVDSTARGVIVDGSDGSKVLQIYDFHVSPNTVKEVVLLGAGGSTVPTGTTVGDSSASSSTPLERKRELSIKGWPSYNSTNAPTSTRTDCSLNQNSDGLVVMAGGNDDDPILLFNQTENTWVNTEKFFNGGQQPLQPSSTSSTTSSSTPTDSVAPSSTTAAGSGGLGIHHNTARTLGITLGVLCGIAAFFILALLLLRWRKMKARQRNGGIDEKNGDDNGNRMSFADRGASFMKEAGISTNDLSPPHSTSHHNNSHSSLAIIAGRIGGRRLTGTQQGGRGSFESTTHLVKDRDGNLVPSENLEMVDIRDRAQRSTRSTLAVPGTADDDSALDKETRDHRKRSSGWSKYFATSAPTGPNGLSHLPSAYVKPQSTTDSQYTENSRPSQKTRILSAALVPPLDIDFSKTVDGQRLSHVAQGSPAFFDSREDLALRGGSIDAQDGQRGVIVDPAEPRKSQATSVSSYGNRSTLSSNFTSDYYHEVGQTPWTPMSGYQRDQRDSDHRPTSSLYTNSVYDPRDRIPSRGKSAGFFPGAGTNYRPPKVKVSLSHSASPTADWASPSHFPAPPKVLPAARAAEENRDSIASDVTVFPSAKDFDESPFVKAKTPALASQQQQQQQQQQTVATRAPMTTAQQHQQQEQFPPSNQPPPTNKATTTDMSWLNLKG